MKLVDVQKPLHKMDDDSLQNLQKDIRKKRMTTVKVEKIVKKRERKASAHLDAMLDAMSPEEKATFMEAVRNAG